MRKNVRLIVSAILLCVLIFMVYQFAFADVQCSMICLYAPDYCGDYCREGTQDSYCWKYWDCCCIYACLNDPENLCPNYGP